MFVFYSVPMRRHGFKSSVTSAAVFACVCVRGDFKADSAKQTEPGHRRMER